MQTVAPAVTLDLTPANEPETEEQACDALSPPARGSFAQPTQTHVAPGQRTHHTSVDDDKGNIIYIGSRVQVPCSAAHTEGKPDVKQGGSRKKSHKKRRKRKPRGCNVADQASSTFSSVSVGLPTTGGDVVNSPTSEGQEPEVETTDFPPQTFACQPEPAVLIEAGKATAQAEPGASDTPFSPESDVPSEPVETATSALAESPDGLTSATTPLRRRELCAVRVPHIAADHISGRQDVQLGRTSNRVRYDQYRKLAELDGVGFSDKHLLDFGRSEALRKGLGGICCEKKPCVLKDDEARRCAREARARLMAARRQLARQEAEGRHHSPPPESAPRTPHLAEQESSTPTQSPPNQRPTARRLPTHSPQAPEEAASPGREGAEPGRGSSVRSSDTPDPQSVTSTSDVQPSSPRPFLSASPQPLGARSWYQVFFGASDDGSNEARRFGSPSTSPSAGTRVAASRGSAPAAPTKRPRKFLVAKHPSSWKPDSSHCESCATIFSWTLRRHHCRACGINVCSSCSPGRQLMLVQLGTAYHYSVEYVHVRVCKNCLLSLPTNSSRTRTPNRSPMTSRPRTPSTPLASRTLTPIPNSNRFATRPVGISRPASATN